MPLHYRILAALLLLTPVTGLTQTPETPIIGAVTIEGASAFRQQDFFPLYKNLLGQALTPQRRRRLEQQIISLYTDRDFAPPTVTFTSGSGPVQVVTVTIDEPKVTSVGIPGLDKSATELRGSITYSLEGSDRLGRQLVYARLGMDNPGHYVSSAYLSALHTVTSSGLQTLGTGITFAPDASNSVDLDIGLAEAKPRDTIEDQVYDRQRYRLRWNHRLIGEDRRESDLFGSFTVRDYTFDVDSANQIDERLRVAGFGMDNLWRWQGRTLSVRVAGRQGLDSLGARREGPGALRDTDLDFGLLESRATLWQALPAGLSLKLNVGGQYTSDHLPFSQRFSVGSYRYARAYEPGEYSGDRGLGGKLEVRRGVTLSSLRDARLVPYAYFGIARTIDNERHEAHSGTAAGLGVRALGKHFYTYLELGQPLTTESAYRGNDLRVTGRLTLRWH